MALKTKRTWPRPALNNFQNSGCFILHSRQTPFQGEDRDDMYRGQFCCVDVIHEYPDLTVHLTLFNATIAEGEPQKIEHNDIQWITPSEISNYEFCPADEEILAKICEVYK